MGLFFFLLIRNGRSNCEQEMDVPSLRGGERNQPLLDMQQVCLIVRSLETGYWIFIVCFDQGCSCSSLCLKKRKMAPTGLAIYRGY